MGISRVTFIINNAGKIVKCYEKVNPATHAKEVTDFIKLLK
jgi:peroxiredoxin